MSSSLPIRPLAEGSSSSNAEPVREEQNDTPPEGWDAPPPDKQPPWQDECETTLLVVQKRQLRNNLIGDEIIRLAFSPDDGLLAFVIRPSSVIQWNTLNVVNLLGSAPNGPYNNVRVHGDFAFAPLPDNALIASYLKATRNKDSISGVELTLLRPGLAIHDLTTRNKRHKFDSCTISGPIAYSPDGTLIAGVDYRDTSRISIVNTTHFTAVRNILHHTDQVTHLAFRPDGNTLVSLSTDGWARLTSTRTGRTLRRYEVSGQRRPSLLRVSPGGDLVVSVWDRSVNLWYPATGVVNVYDLHTVRQREGWPLCISPDCRYLACRTEGGFDVSDLLTGKFRGEVADGMGSVTCAAFSSDSSQMVVGSIDGEIRLYDVLTVD